VTCVAVKDYERERTSRARAGVEKTAGHMKSTRSKKKNQEWGAK